MLFHYDYSKKKYIMHFAPLENIYINYIYIFISNIFYDW